MIPYGKHHIDKDDIKEVVKVLGSNKNITQGVTPFKFSRVINKITKSKYSLVVSSGTAALHLAVKAIGLNEKHNVITTPLTFCATTNVVQMTGAKIKFADIDKESLNIDINQIEKLIDKNTFAIIPVDFRGVPSNIYEIYKLAKKYNLKIITDCSHSLGSKFKHKNKWYHAGSTKFSDISTFSFHPVKHITTGEGGAIITDNKDLYAKCDLLSRHGIYRDKSTINKKKFQGSWYYDLNQIGLNYRITDFQAALGISQIKKLDHFIKRRQEINLLYRNLFSKLPQVEIPVEPINIKTNYHIFVILLKNSEIRFKLYNYLRKNNYAVMIHYIPVYKLKMYKKIFGKNFTLKNAEDYYSRCISIPFYPNLSNNHCLKFFKCVKKFFNE